MFAHQPQVARVLRLQHAQDGQRDRASGDRDDFGHGLAGAVRAARVAVDVAPLDALREVGAAQLDVVAHLGREPLPRKPELAILAVGPDHVLHVSDAAALRARRVGRAIGDLLNAFHLGHAKGAHREQLLALLFALGRHRIRVAFPVAAVVALARRERVVAAALDAVERHPRVRRLVRVEAAHGAGGAVLDEAVVQLEDELVLARLEVEEVALVARDERAPAHGLGRCGWVQRRVRVEQLGHGRRRRRRRRLGREQRDAAPAIGRPHQCLRVDQVLGKGDQVLVHGDVSAHLRELVALRLPRSVQLVVAHQHVAVVAVGARELDVGIRARGDCVVDADFEWIGHNAPGRHEGIKERLLILQRRHDHEAPRLKLEALHQLACHHLGGARAVQLEHRVAFGGLHERAVGSLLVHVKIDF